MFFFCLIQQRKWEKNLQQVFGESNSDTLVSTARDELKKYFAALPKPSTSLTFVPNWIILALLFSDILLFCFFFLSTTLCILYLTVHNTIAETVKKADTCIQNSKFILFLEYQALRKISRYCDSLHVVIIIVTVYVVIVYLQNYLM